MLRSMSGLSSYAAIAVPLAVRGTFAYAIPPELADSVRLGSGVEVPIGPKLSTGFVVALIDDTDVDPKKVKPIRSVLDDEEPALLPEIIELCQWASEYYLAPLGEMLKVALPANMAARGRRQAILTATPEMIAAALQQKQILESDRVLLDELAKRPLPMNAIFEEMKVPRSAVERLRDAGIIALHDRLKDAEGVRFDRFVVLESEGDGLTAKQAAAVELLRSRGGEMSVRAIENAGISTAILSAIVKKGVARIDRRARRHTLDAFLADLDPASVGEIRHSAEQRVAIDTVRATLGTFAPFLLVGVTGSGKTEVY